MPVAAVVGAVGSVAGGLIAASGAKKAAKTQADAANRASDTQLKMYNQTRADSMPYMEVGKGALYSLADLYGLPTPSNPTGGTAFEDSDLEVFRRSPDYQVAMREGIDAYDKSAAAKGMLLSGGQVRELADLGADLGSKNFGNYVSRLMQLVDTGRGAASQTGANAVATGRGVANTQLAAGEASAAGTAGAYNAIGGGLSDAFSNLATYNAYKGMNPSSYVSPSVPLY